MSVGLVVTPERMPRRATSRISSMFAVSRKMRIAVAFQQDYRQRPAAWLDLAPASPGDSLLSQNCTRSGQGAKAAAVPAVRGAGAQVAASVAPAARAPTLLTGGSSTPPGRVAIAPPRESR